MVVRRRPYCWKQPMAALKMRWRACTRSFVATLSSYRVADPGTLYTFLAICVTCTGMIDDPIHTRSGPTTFWTTVNAAEALPGVVTPLTWTLYAPVVEISVRTAFAELGVLRRREVLWPDDPNERFIGVFHGRAAVNLDRF